MPQRLLLLLLLTVVQPLGAQSLFTDDHVLEVELTGPLGALFADKNEEERVEQPFTLNTGGDSHDIMVRIRGNSRVRLCSFPPLRLNFGEETAGTVFTGPQKLKLVTHCSNSRFAETDVLEEFAAYRIMNVLSDISYRVRLLRIRYSNTDGRVRGIDKPRWGFLIEPGEQMAARVGGSEARIPAIPKRRVDQEHAVLMYVFQYLIGNTDWSLVTATGEEYCCHNVTPVDIPSSLYPIPYDFDMAGLVNAAYATPNPKLREIDKVTQRLYRGYCTDPVILRGAIRQVTERRENIRQVIMDLPEMELKKKHQKLAFLERFFKDAAKGDRLFERFEDNCLGKYIGSEK